MLGAAADLNGALIEAAWRAGVHFVDVVGGVESSRHPEGFVGHDPCSGADAWLNGFVVDDEKSNGASGKTFHPTPAGHVGYAEILWQYIVNKSMDPQVRLTETGLPTNPAAVRAGGGDGMNVRGSSVGGEQDAAAPKRAAETRPDSSLRSSDGSAMGEGGAVVERSETSWGVLGVCRAAAVSGCGAPFVSPGEQVTLVAGGFAASAAVTLSAAAASQGDTELAAPTLADVTADAHGRIELAWTVSAAPAAAEDAAPRAYVLNAAGTGAAGEGAHRVHGPAAGGLSGHRAVR